MDAQLKQKLDDLRSRLKDTGGCAIAFSGGVDSSLLLKVAHEVLPGRVLAVLAVSPTYPQEEIDAAIQWVETQGISHIVVQSHELDLPEYRSNPPDRCYHCKKDLFATVIREAQARGFSSVADGSNADDVRDFRPGVRALKEFGVLSPLREAGLTKREIRELAKEVYDLPMWDKPSMACLASRFPYGSPIDEARLHQVGEMERFMRGLGFRVVRARHHRDTVRLELDLEGMKRLIEETMRDPVIQKAKSLGFTYVTMDLVGYRTGSMNEVLPR